MKVLALSFILVFASCTVAKPRDWKNGTVVAIEQGHGVHTSRYSIKSGGTTYVLGTYVIGGCSPFLTLHGTTKIAIEGRNAYFLNDDGKTCKLPIMEKVAEN